MAKPNPHQSTPGRAREPEGTDAVLTWGGLGEESRREVSRGHSISEETRQAEEDREKDRRVTAKARGGIPKAFGKHKMGSGVARANIFDAEKCSFRAETVLEI